MFWRFLRQNIAFLLVQKIRFRTSREERVYRFITSILLFYSSQALNNYLKGKKLQLSKITFSENNLNR